MNVKHNRAMSEKLLQLQTRMHREMLSLIEHVNDQISAISSDSNDMTTKYRCLRMKDSLATLNNLSYYLLESAGPAPLRIGKKDQVEDNVVELKQTAAK